VSCSANGIPPVPVAWSSLDRLLTPVNVECEPDVSPMAEPEPAGTPATPATVNATAFTLLGFLHRGPMSGWELAGAIEGSVGRFWNVTRSQIYRELRGLEARGLVVAGERGLRDRRAYELTDAGRAAFGTRLAEEPGEELIRMPMLLTVFFGEHLDAAQLRAYLQAKQVDHRRRLAEYEGLAPHASTPHVEATIRFGIAYERMVLDWLASQVDEGA
jgi:DNA-binding PadR family transcriptional regulator